MYFSNVVTVLLVPSGEWIDITYSSGVFNLEFIWEVFCAVRFDKYDKLHRFYLKKNNCMSAPIYVCTGGWGEFVRPCFRRHWLSRHLTLISLEMGTRQQALMGWTAVSLWEEAAPLERNRTGCDEAMDGFGGRNKEGAVLVGLAQVRHNKPLSPQLGLHCCKRH